MSLFPVCPAVLLSGVIVGVMQESGMLDAMVQAMISVIAQPQLCIATDLTGITIDEHITFTWLKLWAVNILVVLFGIVTSVFMP